MWAILFGLGVLMAIVVVIGLLRLTATTEPTGCVIVYGSLILLAFLGLIASQIF